MNEWMNDCDVSKSFEMRDKILGEEHQASIGLDTVERL